MSLWTYKSSQKASLNQPKDDTPLGSVPDSVLGNVNNSGGYEILTERFSIALLGEKVPHTRTYMRKSVANRVCFIVAQVANEDRSKVTEGFELIFSSFTYRTP